MKAAVLIKTGKARSAFAIREMAIPAYGDDEVLIKVAAFGLNFADVMARRGMYKEAPPIPALLGYDVAGTVEAVGKNVQHLKAGDRVTAMTRFGGYAEYAVTKAAAATVIPDETDYATATALTTQYCTAVYAATEMVNLHAGDKVLIHSGAGGVGTALIQIALQQQCEIYSTAGSESKLQYLRSCGVHHPINYVTDDFEKIIKQKTNGKGVDVIFDAVGGKSVKKGFRSLAAGGRLICYGAAEMSNKNIFGKIAAALAFGFYHPVMLMVPSKAIIGINMLRIADEKPADLQRCLQTVMDMYKKGIIKPLMGKSFPISELAEAHDYLESRKSMGKIAITW